MDFSKIPSSGPQNSQKSQNWNVCVQYVFFKMNEKVPQKLKKWKFCVFHVFSRSLFGVFSVKNKKWKTLITGNRCRQSWKNPWNLVRTLIDGIRKWHKILKFAKLFQNNYQCNFALTAKLHFHRNLIKKSKSCDS